MKYHNRSEAPLTLVNYGVIAPGATIEDYRVIENPNLEVVDATPTPEPAPENAIHDAPPVQPGEQADGLPYEQPNQ